MRFPWCASKEDGGAAAVPLAGERIPRDGECAAVERFRDGALCLRVRGRARPTARFLYHTASRRRPAVKAATKHREVRPAVTLFLSLGLGLGFAFSLSLDVMGPSSSSLISVEKQIGGGTDGATFTLTLTQIYILGTWLLIPLLDLSLGDWLKS